MTRVLQAALLAFSIAPRVDLPTGQIIDKVSCSADPSQSYALYLPKEYSRDRAWPVMFAFDPGGRGRNPVERYQVAAEQYHYIVAGSNNSRNGSPDIGKAVAAMTADVSSRFRVDPARIYLAGMSGGARVALGVALGSPQRIAGVVASSAGYPDSTPHKTLPFPLFATAGTEDFNHLEMRQIDRALTSPHRLAIFNGGHVWLSSDLAIEAIEWMELQAMKSGLEPRNDAEIEGIFVKRSAAVAGSALDAATFLALQAIVEDFSGLRDVSALATRAAVLGRDKTVRAALKKDRDDDDRELALLSRMQSAEARLGSLEDRTDALVELRDGWKTLSEQARKPDDSAERRLARRVLAALSAGLTTTDADYLQIVNQYRLPRTIR